METSPPNPSIADARRPAGFDPKRRFVRVRRWRDDGFVEFDFAIGSPDLHVELILPRAGFEVFRQLPGTDLIDASTATAVEAAEQAYLYGADPESTPAHAPAFPSFLPVESHSIHRHHTGDNTP